MFGRLWTRIFNYFYALKFKEVGKAAWPFFTKCYFCYFVNWFDGQRISVFKHKGSTITYYPKKGTSTEKSVQSRPMLFVNVAFCAVDSVAGTTGLKSKELRHIVKFGTHSKSIGITKPPNKGFCSAFLTSITRLDRSCFFVLT